jgi:PDZ domain-containing protein
VAPRLRIVRLVTPGRLVGAGLVLAVVAVALWALPSSEYIFLPDRARPVAPLVRVAGHPAPARDGHIYFVDVIVRKASMLERLFGGLHSGADLVPSSDVVEPGLTGTEQEALDAADMRRSQQVAAAVAERALGRKVTATPTGVLVIGVESGFPADGKLHPEDVIVAVDGKRVRTPSDLAALMRAKHVGDLVRFTVKRGKAERVIVLKTVRASARSQRAVVGVFPGQAVDIRVPIKVSIDSSGVVGPSAGLAFALDVLEQLGRDVAHGHNVAATGEIFLNGAVGPIGGIKQKTFGAREAGVDAFLVPAGQNAREARRYAHGLRIIPVKSFQQALRALATLRG